MAARPKRAGGRYVTVSTAGERARAYIPDPLPPKPPPSLSPADWELYARASAALGRLDGVAELLPNVDLLLYYYVRKEALLSSQIEGTQSSFEDLLLYESAEAPGVPVEDVEEVSRYVAAINLGMKRLRGGLPISLRLIRELHAELLASGRGARKAPGEFRRSQNWIGGPRPGVAVFVPPPPDRVLECMGALEKFIHDKPERTPTLLKAAFMHVQFETIHPFLDGNGRLGRLLITLLLCAEGGLREPLLYLSLYFKQRRAEYYDWLQNVRLTGDWEGWIRFFLEGVVETAEEGVATARTAFAYFAEDRERIAGLGRTAAAALRVHDFLERRPIASIPRIAKGSGLSAPTAAKTLGRLQRLGIVEEITGRRRGRLFVYRRLTELLGEGTEPLR